jgi:hypothetical protein
MAISLRVAGGHCAREDDSVAPEPEGRARPAFLFFSCGTATAERSSFHFLLRAIIPAMPMPCACMALSVTMCHSQDAAHSNPKIWIYGTDIATQHHH